MKKIYVIHSTAFDYVKNLYTPLKNISEFEFIFPHEEGNDSKNSTELIRSCDIVLAEVSYPSTGSGIEIGRAECLNIPIVAIYKNGSNASSAIKFVTNNFLEYDDLGKDLDKIKSIISNIK